MASARGSVFPPRVIFTPESLAYAKSTFSSPSCSAGTLVNPISPVGSTVNCNFCPEAEASVAGTVSRGTVVSLLTLLVQPQRLHSSAMDVRRIRNFFIMFHLVYQMSKSVDSELLFSWNPASFDFLFLFLSYHRKSGKTTTKKGKLSCKAPLADQGEPTFCYFLFQDNCVRGMQIF